MEQIECGGSRNENSVSDFKCEDSVLSQKEKTLITSPATVKKKGVDEKQALDILILSQTPQKTSEPLKFKEESKEFKNLEKSSTLVELFDSMVRSLRLLNLRGSQPTFESICTQVEFLTKRKFSYRHLAQIKYILPEAIHIEVGKIRKQDKELVYAKPDMLITLLLEDTNIESGQSKYSLLCEDFSSRLTNFYDMHPKACDIPEAVLPEPFTYVYQNITTENYPVESVGQSQSIACEFEQPIQASHLGSSFRSRFSQSAAVTKTEDSEVCACPSSLPTARSGNLYNKSDEIKPLVEVSGLHSKSGNSYNESDGIEPLVEVDELDLESDHVSEQNSISEEDEKSITSESSISSVGFRNLDSPQVKDASATTDALTIETPVQLMSRRSVTGSDKGKRVTSSSKPAKRSLNFSALEEYGSSLNLDDELKRYADTARIATDSSKPPQKVEGVHGHFSNDDMMMQTKVACKQSVIYGPDLVHIISHVFRSVNSSSITKGELVYKIIMNSLDIIAKREVEEQIELLEKLAPDFICRKLASTGDVMYSILKSADLDSVRERIKSA